MKAEEPEVALRRAVAETLGDDIVLTYHEVVMKLGSTLAKFNIKNAAAIGKFLRENAVKRVYSDDGRRITKYLFAKLRMERSQQEAEVSLSNGIITDRKM